MKVQLLLIFIYSVKGDTNISDTKYTYKFYDIANTLTNILGIDDSEKNTRIPELKNKLGIIDSYLTNQEEFAKSLLNETIDPNLNETNFYYALIDNDQFQFRYDKDPKALFMKLKERLNRDDILNIVVKRHARRSIIRSARRMMEAEGTRYHKDDELLDDVIDKVIAETPTDNHNFSTPPKSVNYWDPKAELEDLKNYHRKDNRRIYKGDKTTIKHYPFMVSIPVMNRFWCGGVIYWADMIITSASCLQIMHNNRYFRENPKILEVRVGSNHSRLGGEMIEALEVFFHPSYDPRCLHHNLAMIRLQRQIRFTTHRIPKMIDITHNPNYMPSTSKVLLLGWGVTKLSQKMAYEPIFLQRKILPVYPASFCSEIYGDKFMDKMNMFCAGTMTSGEGACDHDAGGPAVLAGRLVGVISFGPTICGYPNVPTVFTLIGAYADWIETINETMPGYYRGSGRTTTTTEDPNKQYLNTYPLSHDAMQTIPRLLVTMDGKFGK